MQDRQKRIMGLSQATYIDIVPARIIDIVPARISTHSSKKGFVPLRLGKILSSYQHFKTHTEIDTL